MAMSKRKATTVVVAGVAAAALLIGGTFAWTSIQQEARNEAIVDINPGGRLHDDFDGTNKDVYVENFGDETTGVPIFARIRLDQYFEVGQEAGKNKDSEEERNVKVEVGGAVYDEGTWVTYKPVDADGTPLDTLTNPVVANGNWQWTLGNDDTNKPIYLPTFNKNKDSLAADINGTYEGTTEDDIVHYDDHKTYAEGQAVPGTEIYDWDEDTNEEDEESEYDNGGVTDNANTPIDDADVYHKSQNEDGTELTHTAKPIDYAATVMTMAEWIAAGSQPGPYWVYDTDGWAYWAQPIQPGETTGLLLDSIQLSKVPDDNWYYGINVVGQFATAGDIGAFGNGATEEQTWTPAAENLFAAISNAEVLTIDGVDRIAPGGTATFTATRTVGGVEASLPALTWTATDAEGNAIEDITMADGTLTVGEDVADGTQITVTATAGDGTAAADGETAPLSATKLVTVKEIPEFRYTLTDGEGVTVDSYFDNPWLNCVVANENGETLLLTVNRNIDLDATLNHEATNTEKCGVVVTMDTDTDGEDTLRITFSGTKFSGVGFDNINGMSRPVARMVLVTEYEDAVYVDFLLKPTEDALLVLSVNDTEFDGTTALNNGDVLSVTYNGEQVPYFHSDFLKEGIQPGTFGLYDNAIYNTDARTEDKTSQVLFVSESTPTQEVDIGIWYYADDGTFCYKKFEKVTINQPTATETEPTE